MDAGIAAILAASISVIVGGLVGFLSSYFTTRQAHEHARAQATLPKQMTSAELIALVLFKTLSGETQSDYTWDQYISSCFWLPNDLRSTCLAVLGNENDIHALRLAQAAVIRYISDLTKGSTQ